MRCQSPGGMRKASTLGREWFRSWCGIHAGKEPTESYQLPSKVRKASAQALAWGLGAQKSEDDTA